MEALEINPTEKTPKIIGDPVTGKILISGICIPEDGLEFFDQIKNWIMEYMENPAEKTEFIIDLEYFNTTTSILLLNLFKIFDKGINDGYDIKMVWCYDHDDPDMKEAGGEYEFMVTNSIEFREKK